VLGDELWTIGEFRHGEPNLESADPSASCRILVQL
jgi:hypothetical protein